MQNKAKEEGLDDVILFVVDIVNEAAIVSYSFQVGGESMEHPDWRRWNCGFARCAFS